MFVFCNPCARAELHQQKRARKLCSATLIGSLRNQDATPRTTMIKKRFYILPTNTNLAVPKVIYFVCHCQSCHELNLGQGETFEIKIKKN